jgi:hypothetical protein
MVWININTANMNMLNDNTNDEIIASFAFILNKMYSKTRNITHRAIIVNMLPLKSLNKGKINHTIPFTNLYDEDASRAAECELFAPPDIDNIKRAENIIIGNAMHNSGTIFLLKLLFFILVPFKELGHQVV